MILLIGSGPLRPPFPPSFSLSLVSLPRLLKTRVPNTRSNVARGIDLSKEAAERKDGSIFS